MARSLGKRLLLLSVLLCALAVPAFTRPEYSSTTAYYDEYGNLVGETYISCAGFRYNSQWGEVTPNYTVFFEQPCGIIEFPFCEDVGLVSTSCQYYCVTEGYYLSAVSGIIPDSCIPRQ